MLLFSKTSETTTAHVYLLYTHSKQTKSTQNRPNTNDTKLQKVCTTNRPKNRTDRRAHIARQKRCGALNAMRSRRRETKDKREVERATRDETET